MTRTRRFSGSRAEPGRARRRVFRSALAVLAALSLSPGPDVAKAHETRRDTPLVFPVPAPGAEGDGSGSFQNEVLISPLNLPIAVKFLPDGDMAILELGGKIWKADTTTWQVRPVPLLSLTNIGTQNGQQGLMDMVLDPAFAANRYFYVFYTLGSPNRDRVSRFTANADVSGTVPGSELVLYQDPQDANAEHHGGALNFGNDGKLYVTTGEHFDPNLAQDLASPRGKVLRFNQDGTVPTDNPFFDGGGPHYDAVWALGLRNPFRSWYDAIDGKLYIGDVGGNLYTTAEEEIHVGARGANFGWPICEGFSCGSNPAYASPLYAYAHDGRDAAVVGGFVYHGTQFPPAYRGNYFFGDYSQNWIKRLVLGGSGGPVLANFVPEDGAPDGPWGDIVYMTEGPDGALYYVDLGYSDTTGEVGISKVRRVRYISNNQPPIVSASAQPTTGPSPLSVTFSSAGTSDPENDPLTYAWTFGDGGTSSASNPVHVYATNGTYQARLSVSDATNTTLSSPITIRVGHVPVPSMRVSSDRFRAGDVVRFKGGATDVEDGLLAPGAFTWNVDFLHEGHVHPALPLAGVDSGDFTVPSTNHDFHGNTRYRITLTATDSDGLQASTSTLVFPEKVDLVLDTEPSGLPLRLDGVTLPTPLVYDTLIGFHHTISAPDHSIGFNQFSFWAWSDGGTREHGIVVPSAASTFIAKYSEAASPFPAGLVAGYRFDEGSGTTAADISDTHANGTLVNGPAWAAGQYGGGIRFHGTDYVDAGNPLPLRLTQSMTLTAWIRATQHPVDDAAIVAKMGAAGWQLKTSRDTGQRVAALQITGPASQEVQRYGSTALALDTWYHVAGVYDATTQRMSVYVNAVLDDGPLAGVVPASQLDASVPMQVGQRPGSPQLFNFRGDIDEVHVFDRALTAAEIQVDMTTPR